jgi:hypothetical protein
MSRLTKKDLMEIVAAVEQRVRAEMQIKIHTLEEKLHDMEISIRTASLHATRVNETRMKNLETFQETSTKRLANLEWADITRELDRRR